eukprot:482655_1
MGSDFPLYSYKQYSSNLRYIAHEADEWIPLIAMIYTFLAFVLYCQQYITRYRLWFSSSTKPLHAMGTIALLILFLYEVLNYLLANNFYSNLPSPIDSCTDYIRLIFIAFVFVKYAMVFCIVLNLSYTNQNPFINPRYKYIGKQSRIRLKRFFNILIVIVCLFLVGGIYGAWIHTAADEYVTSPNNFKYCTQTFTIYTFFFTFGGDILGVFLYGCLFGRNACELTRRKVKPNQRHKYDEGNLSDVGEYDDDKLGNHKEINYDLDDPICNKLDSENKIYSINTSNNKATNINSLNTNKLFNKYGGGYTENLILDVNDDSDDDYMAKMNKDKIKLKQIRQSTLIEAEERISEEEIRGIREQKRVLQIIWIMLIFYWLNILLNISCLTLIISSTCIVLMNDYEFGSTYWQCRTFICNTGSCLCCICNRIYFCNNYFCGSCFCGQQKVYKDDFDPGYKAQFDRSNVTDEHKPFVRL